MRRAVVGRRRVGGGGGSGRKKREGGEKEEGGTVNVVKWSRAKRERAREGNEEIGKSERGLHTMYKKSKSLSSMERKHRELQDRATSEIEQPGYHLISCCL